MLQKPLAYLAQINCIALDLAGNAAQIIEAAKKAEQAGAPLCLTPALSLTGSPLESWCDAPDFRVQLEAELRELAQTLAKKALDVCVVVGAPAFEGKKRFNALYAFKSGKCVARCDKRELSEDEARYFDEGDKSAVISAGGVKIGLAHADDLLHEKHVHEFKHAGVELLCASSNWRYMRGVGDKRREKILAKCAKEKLPLIAVNLAGAQDEFIYEGASFATCGKNYETLMLAAFEADEGWVLRSSLFEQAPCEGGRPQAGHETLLRALTCAVRDYVGKSGFKDVVLGLSGGADSALVAALAVEALGCEHVHAVMMPTRYTSDLSLRLAQECAQNLGIDFRVRPIGGMFDAAMHLLEKDFAGTEPGLAEENLQARSRGTLLMALSNKFGWLVLTTGNKSEGAVGYCTLYGDTAGGYDPIKDVFKTDVWELLRTYNRLKGKDVVPPEIITRAPSAELKEGQTDEAALMPYAELDVILSGLLQEGLSVQELVDRGCERAQIERVLQLWHRSEYKRRQSPTGPIVSRGAFAAGARLPLASSPSFL